ncbi:uncharacterized protein Tco025E_01257 [Trypanosoma conorhini]|uniref:Uncharacterized protein n=1 Tax=Trypanosoma conorhini TaxID=83891 RepID=A0A3R7LFQ6_9TRYP|nr:uncharacterized protein Tco025E_01257 [Trypanosoma conorhini]RNF26396.1 hypothetical protein Tco025E_01257 [Trypanosoma conorhini]
MNRGGLAPVAPGEDPHSAWKRALETNAAHGDARSPKGTVSSTNPVMGGADAALLGGRQEGATGGGRGPKVPLTAMRGANTVYLRKNVLDFLHDMYGTKPFQDPVAPTNAAATEPQKLWWMRALAPTSGSTSKGAPTVPERVPLRRVSSHQGSMPGRDPSQPRASGRLCASEDQLETLVDHILQGYMHTRGRSKGPAPALLNRPEASDTISQFVSTALDKLLVTEASFSHCDAASARSFLSLGVDHNFSKLASFNAQSQFFQDDEESELLVNPAFEGNLAMFAPVTSQAAISVSDSLPPIEATRLPSPSAVSPRPIRRGQVPPPVPAGGNPLEDVFQTLSRQMSLDSAKVELNSTDSWEGQQRRGRRCAFAQRRGGQWAETEKLCAVNSCRRRTRAAPTLGRHKIG